MPIGTGATDVGFLLGRRGAVGTGDVAFLLGFGLHLAGVVTFGAFCGALEGNAMEDDTLDVVTTVLITHSADL